MSRKRGSGRWLEEHQRDPFVLKARKDGWRSRAVYKLEELSAKDRLIRPGYNIVDLGAAPGGWSQYAARLLKGRGRLIAVDLLEMDPLAGVDIIQGDFREQEVLDRITALLAGDPVHLVMCDMAPNISGVRAVDQPRAMYLAELALDFAKQVSAPGASLLVKLFHGEGFDTFVRDVRPLYENVKVRKPGASKSRSREVYMVARNYRL